MDKDSAIYVRHMLDAIANIEADIAGYDFERFRADRRTRQLVERNLEILSEASRRLPEELKVDEAHIPWRAMFSGTITTIPTQLFSGIPARRT